MIPISTVIPIANSLDIQSDRVQCQCGASCENTSRKLARFLKRHPAKCSERREFTKQLAEGVRSVEADSDRDDDQA